ncbi:helix-turn-helix domain-containing protein [Dyadobacter sp. CY345]|uniref:helix-turn-helix domain-containing protein n=1 Tax=Dyadobacter sp. CY345 TaxID=2909335 RepID=UPI001F2F5BE9|nr:helix-turn-helix domain-containing protein [Dyadobacter sp. CY345]MCF2443312.1 helix-turn-helix domain-containing protein [Dyadobacter sp. CY345]
MRLSINNGLLYLDGELSRSWLVFVVLFLVIEPVCLVLFYRLLRSYKKRIFDTLSNTDRINLSWLYVLFFLWLLISLILVPIGTLTISRGSLSTGILELLIESASILFFFLVGFYGVQQTTIFSNLELQEIPIQTATRNYERSGLNPQRAKELHALLLKLITEEKPYLDGDLTAGILSQMLGISVNHLSQVLNQQQNQNFFDFINSYRVEEVIRRMKDPRNRHLTLLALALDSGFNSKTSFNTIFKKVTKQTPSEFYKSLPK